MKYIYVVFCREENENDLFTVVYNKEENARTFCSELNGENRDDMGNLINPIEYVYEEFEVLDYED